MEYRWTWPSVPALRKRFLDRAERDLHGAVTSTSWALCPWKVPLTSKNKPWTNYQIKLQRLRLLVFQSLGQGGLPYA